jgi:hypothetical protein
VSRSSFLKRALLGRRGTTDSGEGGHDDASIGDHCADVTDPTSEDHTVAPASSSAMPFSSKLTSPPQVHALSKEQSDVTFEITPAADPITHSRRTKTTRLDTILLSILGSLSASMSSLAVLLSSSATLTS